MKQTGAGFTLIELMVTIVVMVILMGLGVAAIGNIQANGRDSEREQDAASIARGLEQRYTQGNPIVTAPAPDVQKGSYPSINEFVSMQGGDRTAQGYIPGIVSGGYFTKNLPGTVADNFTSPSSLGWTYICGWACQPAGNSAQIAAAFGGQDKYIYEPVDAAGNICSSGNCVRYNLYWKKETDLTVVNGIAGLQVVKSRHQ